MTQQLWTAVDSYINDRLLEADAVLDRVLEASNAAGLPSIAVSPNQGKLLFIMAKAIGAKRILELGTLGGYSAIWLARALPADGRLVTIEVDPKHADVARQNFALAGVAHVIDLRVGQALEVLRSLEDGQIGPFDFTFIDANKDQYFEYVKWAIRLSRPGGVIVADNVVRDGAVIEATSGDSAVRGVRRFMDSLTSNRRVAATALQTVGTKGYDGLAVILVNEG